MRTITLVLFLAFTSHASAQDPLVDFRFKLEAQRLEMERQRAESISKLREAIVNLRDVRRKSCQFRNGSDCYLAELSSVELVLLDIEDAYRRGENRTQNEAGKTNYKKIQEFAGTLRSNIDELTELIEKAER